MLEKWQIWTIVLGALATAWSLSLFMVEAASGIEATDFLLLVVALFGAGLVAWQYTSNEHDIEAADVSGVFLGSVITAFAIIWLVVQLQPPSVVLSTVVFTVAVFGVILVIMSFNKLDTVLSTEEEERKLEVVK